MPDLVEVTVGIEVELPSETTFHRKRRLIADELGIEAKQIASVEQV